LDKCFRCEGDEPCEYCIWEDIDQTVLSKESQCYFPY
jgi:hypothetical protein